MPAKRKQPSDAAEPSTRTTRTSTRAATAKNTAASRTKGAAAATKNVDHDMNDSDAMESVHSAKRARTGASTAKSKKTATKASGVATGQIDEELNGNGKPISQKVAAAPVASPTVRTAPATKAPAAKKQKSEPFTPARALALFSTYADKDDVEVIGPEGYQQLCSDANMNLEGTQPLILAWQIGTSEMGKITKEEWVKWTNTVKIASVDSLALAISDLDQLLMSGTSPKSSSKDYDKTAITAYAADPKGTFLKFYLFCFNLTKAPQSKNIEMETSVAMWGVLLVPKYPIMADVLEFINEKSGVYRGTNKDLWGMMFEFCDSVSPDLHDFEADGAWPTLLDDFYGWKKAKGEAGNAMPVDS